MRFLFMLFVFLFLAASLMFCLDSAADVHLLPMWAYALSFPVFVLLLRHLAMAANTQQSANGFGVMVYGRKKNLLGPFGTVFVVVFFVPIAPLYTVVRLYEGPIESHRSGSSEYSLTGVWWQEFDDRGVYWPQALSFLVPGWVLYGVVLTGMHFVFRNALSGA